MWTVIGVCAAVFLITWFVDLFWFFYEWTMSREWMDSRVDGVVADLDSSNRE